MLTPQMNLFEIEQQHGCEIIIEVFHRILEEKRKIDAIRCGPRQFFKKVWYEAHFQRKTAVITYVERTGDLRDQQ